MIYTQTSHFRPLEQYSFTKCKKEHIHFKLFVRSYLQLSRIRWFNLEMSCWNVNISYNGVIVRCKVTLGKFPVFLCPTEFEQKVAEIFINS